MGKQYDFRQAVRIGRHTFPLGIREVPAEFEKHPHFQGFLKSGYVRVAGAAQADKKLSDLPVLPPPSTEAAKRSSIAASAVERGQMSAEIAPDAEIGGDADPEAEVAPEADEEGDEESKKGKSKKRNGR